MLDLIAGFIQMSQTAISQKGSWLINDQRDCVQHLLLTQACRGQSAEEFILTTLIAFESYLITDLPKSILGLS